MFSLYKLVDRVSLLMLFEISDDNNKVGEGHRTVGRCSCFYWMTLS